MNKITINRRAFLSKSTVCMAGVGIAGSGTVYSRQNSNQEQQQTAIREYRMLGRTGFKVSDIGCGYPGTASESVLKAAIAGGINFIDSIEGHGSGNSEVTIGRAIKISPRESLFINSKIAVTDKDTRETLISRVRKSLERLDTPYIDGLMLWSANTVLATENKVFHSAVRNMKKEGIVRFSGVSCHGSNYAGEPPETMDKVICAAIDSGHFDLVMFVYNYVQKEMGEKILEQCMKKNVGAILMKTDPFGGAYNIVTNMVSNYQKENKEIPPNIQNVYSKIMKRQEEAMPFLMQYGLSDINARKKAAVSFVLNHPSVSTVLISFSNFTEVADYINLSGSRLNEKTTSVINSLMDTFGPLYCRHACGLCESSCPNGVPVNKIMRYNHYFMAQSREKYAISQYLQLGKSNAGNCAGCIGNCEAACPFGVPIHALLKDAHRNLNLT
ncbi:MAG: aldo/keto reductase [Bacteroidales bacterium]